MANRSGRRLPSLRLHRPSGQAVVRLVNRDGQRRDYYLGKHGGCEAQERYQQLLLRSAPTSSRAEVLTICANRSEQMFTDKPTTLKHDRHG